MATTPMAEASARTSQSTLSPSPSPSPPPPQSTNQPPKQPPQSGHGEEGMSAKDALKAVKLTFASEWRRLVRCFIQVPLGVVAMLAACFGIDRLLNLGGVSFPASVACLVILFLVLLLCDLVLGRRRTDKVVQVINIPGGWSLRWMNLFFVQSFVMLPLSPHISFVEVIKLILMFVLGFLLMMVVSVYMTRWIQRWTSPPRKALLPPPEPEASETETETETKQLPSSDTLFCNHPPKGLPPRPPRSRVTPYITVRGQNLDDDHPFSPFNSDGPAPTGPQQLQRTPSSYSTAQRSYRPGNGGDSRAPTPPPPSPSCSPEAPPPTAHAPVVDYRLAWALSHLDTVFFLSVLLLVGVPVYYSTGYGMPLHLCINILAFFCAMKLPALWRQILHPVIVSAFSSLLLIWLLGRIRDDSLATTLHAYRPQYTYIKLWANAGSGGQRLLPGAGDILSSLLDVSIVSLALPMFQYRYELKTHFAAIVVPNIAISVASLFGYPVVAHGIGISATRSLALTSRSLTLALATPAVKNLGGDLNTIAAITILSGVFGVLVGARVLRLLRVPDDDYVTRGVAYGANASALGTALLLRIDPPAAAISSLSMSLFGTITVAFCSIPPVVTVIRSLVGL